MNEEIKQIKNTKRYFISNMGYCFKVEGIKEIKIPIRIIRGIPRVKIQNSKMNMIYLMIEHFMDLNWSDLKYSYKITDGKIPLDNIKVKRISNSYSEDEKLIFKYKCKEKASSSNSRKKHTETLSEIDVLTSLKRTDFKCFYCGDNIKSKKWHLDHVIPISLGGRNHVSNIISSCEECNLMKGALRLKTFLKKVYKINKRFNQ